MLAGGDFRWPEAGDVLFFSPRLMTSEDDSGDVLTESVGESNLATFAFYPPSINEGNWSWGDLMRGSIMLNS